jgi:hypothetical protein
MQSEQVNFDFIFLLLTFLPKASDKYQDITILPIFHAIKIILVFILRKESGLIERLIHLIDR